MWDFRDRYAQLPTATPNPPVTLPGGGFTTPAPPVPSGRVRQYRPRSANEAGGMPSDFQARPYWERPRDYVTASVARPGDRQPLPRRIPRSYARPANEAGAMPEQINLRPYWEAPPPSRNTPPASQPASNAPRSTPRLPQLGRPALTPAYLDVLPLERSPGYQQEMRDIRNSPGYQEAMDQYRQNNPRPESSSGPSRRPPPQPRQPAATPNRPNPATFTPPHGTRPAANNARTRPDPNPRPPAVVTPRPVGAPTGPPRIGPGTRIGPHPATFIPAVVGTLAPDAPRLPERAAQPTPWQQLAPRLGLPVWLDPQQVTDTIGPWINPWHERAGNWGYRLGNWLQGNGWELPSDNPNDPSLLNPIPPPPEDSPWQGDWGQFYRVTYSVRSRGETYGPYVIEMWGPWAVFIASNPNASGYEITQVYSAGRYVQHPFFNQHSEANLEILNARGVPIASTGTAPAPQPLPIISPVRAAPNPNPQTSPPGYREPYAPPQGQGFTPVVPFATPAAPGARPAPALPPQLNPPGTPAPGGLPNGGGQPGAGPGRSLTPAPSNSPNPQLNGTVNNPPTGEETLTCRFRDDPYSQETRNIAQANGRKLDNLLGLILDGEILRKVNTIDQKMGPQLVGGVGGFLRKFSRSSLVNQAQNTLAFLATLHNAMMLSNNLRLTLFGAFDLIYELPGMDRFAPRDPETDEQISYGEWAGDQMDSLLRSAFGDQTVDTVRNGWNKANRVYQAATNLLFAIQSIMWSMQEALEVVGEYVAKIGNAARRFGVFTERAYAWMNPQAANSRRINRFYNFMYGASEQVENIERIAAATLDVTESTAELTRQSADFADLVRGVDENGQPNETLSAFEGTSPEPEPIALAEDAATTTAQRIRPDEAITATDEVRPEEE